MTYYLVVFALTMLVSEALITWFQRLFGMFTNVDH